MYETTVKMIIIGIKREKYNYVIYCYSLWLSIRIELLSFKLSEHWKFVNYAVTGNFTYFISLVVETNHIIFSPFFLLLLLLWVTTVILFEMIKGTHFWMTRICSFRDVHGCPL